MSETELDHFWAVIPAGGAGTRLWPLSRSGSPKFLHDLTGSGRTLIQATVDRLAPLAGDRVLVVTGRSHRDAVCDQVPEVDPQLVVAEPSGRDSMAAIGLAAALLERRDPDAIIGSFAADHVITDPVEFRRIVAVATDVARHDKLVTIGIEPTHPATGFGYIDVGEALSVAGSFEVREFVEKPSEQVAERYVAEGYRWNAGMFVARPGLMLDLLATRDPEFAAALRAIAAQPQTLESVWPTLPKIAFDHAVAEPAAAAGRVAVVPGDFGWDDIGDFAALRAILDSLDSLESSPTDRDNTGLTVLGDPALSTTVDTTGFVAPAAGRMIAVVGLDDIVVVDTPDALLVTTRSRAQDVKEIVASLKAKGHDHLT